SFEDRNIVVPVTTAASIEPCARANHERLERAAAYVVTLALGGRALKRKHRLFRPVFQFDLAIVDVRPERDAFIAEVFHGAHDARCIASEPAGVTSDDDAEFPLRGLREELQELLAPLEFSSTGVIFVVSVNAQERPPFLLDEAPRLLDLSIDGGVLMHLAT